MVKKMISGFLALLLILCAFSPAVYADDEHQHTFGEVTDTVDTKGLKLPNGQDFPVNVSITKSPCSTPGISCGKVLYSWNFGGRGGSFVDDKDLPVAEVIKRWYEWNERFYGNNVGFTQFQAGGGSASPGGVGRFPKGYQNETGDANVSCSGKLHFSVSPSMYVDSIHSNTYQNKIQLFKDDHFGSVSSDGYLFFDTYGSVLGSRVTEKFGTTTVYVYALWKFQAPCDGIYYINQEDSVQNLGHWEWLCGGSLYTGDYSSYDVPSSKNQYGLLISANKGQTLYYAITPFSHARKGSEFDFIKYQLNNLIITCEPSTATVINQNSITINNNTFNGNIYVDNTNKLTYIYPQYTVNNETKISNNPIIYNEETKQYYVYDQTTNNYYYITYGDPAPTPTPSPSPDPGGSGGGDNPSGGGSSGGGSGGGSSGGSSGSGSSWWGKLLDKLGSALIDGLLDAIKGILKLLFDLISSILGWIIWLCSKVFDLFPFLPPGVGALLVGGVVVCFILAFIKFIRG